MQQCVTLNLPLSSMRCATLRHGLPCLWPWDQIGADQPRPRSGGGWLGRGPRLDRGQGQAPLGVSVARQDRVRVVRVREVDEPGGVVLTPLRTGEEGDR